MAVSHVKSVTVGDSTDTNVVRPSDWNSGHNQVLNIAGNTAGTAQVSGTDIVFAGGNNVTLSANGSTVSINAGAGGVALAGSNAQTATSGTVVFSNSNGITFGMSGSTRMTASHNGLTSQSGQAYAAGNGSVAFQTLSFADSNGVSWSTGTQGLYASINVPGGTNSITAAGNTILASSGTQQANNIYYSGAGAVSLGMNGNTLVISAPASSAVWTGTFSAGATTDAQGTTGLAQNQLVFREGSGIYLSQSLQAGSATLSIGQDYPILLSYQNRQLGASVYTAPGNSSVWMCPFRIAGGIVSASSILVPMYFTGTTTSATAETWSGTIRLGLYSNNTTNSTRFDSFWTTSVTAQAYKSGTSTQSFAINGTTSSSAGSGLLSQNVQSIRLFTFPIGSTLGPGLYCYGFYMSTNTAGVSRLMAGAGPVLDNPANQAGAYFFGATASSVGIVDGGVWGTTTTNLPASVGISDIRQTNNLMPFFRLGCL